MHASPSFQFFLIPLLYTQTAFCSRCQPEQARQDVVVSACCDRFNFDTLTILKNCGYKFFEADYFGYVQGILINSEDNSMPGWSNPRSNGQVSGY